MVLVSSPFALIHNSEVLACLVLENVLVTIKIKSEKQSPLSRQEGGFSVTEHCYRIVT